MRGEQQVRLVVFSDDWGRHPSSSQHLVRQLLDRYPTLWVNTIGTRAPRLSRADLGRAAGKLGQWLKPGRNGSTTELPQNLQVIHPRMWPGFRRGWQRRLNAVAVARAVHAALGPRQPNERRVAITTLPVTADLVGRLDVDRWVYYCVDDFAAWPGLDAAVMEQMERVLVQRVDAAVAVSPALRQRLLDLGGPDAPLLTHGIDLGHWSAQSASVSQTDRAGSKREVQTLPQWCRTAPRPIFLFWGLVDQRLDVSWCEALPPPPGGSLVLVGPAQAPDPRLARLRGVVLAGPAAYADLPALAQAAEVLVMPYADLPVTRAMQPLKFKEYLATGKPVVARRLPGIAEWADAADLVDTAAEFAQRCRLRAQSGLPAEQAAARRRLEGESWEHKARQLESVLLGAVRG